MDTGARVTLEIGMVLEDRICKAGFTLRRIRRPFCALGERFLGHQCRSTP